MESFFHPLSVRSILKYLMANSKYLEVKIASNCVFCEYKMSSSDAWAALDILLHLQKLTVTCQSSMQIRSILAESAQSVVDFFKATFSLHAIFIEEREWFCFPPLSPVLKVFETDKDICILNLCQPFLSSQKLLVIRQLTCWDQYVFIFFKKEFYRNLHFCLVPIELLWRHEMQF